MLATLIFILILGVLIFVHELGHFVVARRNGIKAEEFGFGFPPRIFGVQKVYKEKGRGKWRFIWGMRDGDDENEKEDKKEISQKKLWVGTIYSINWIPLGGFVKIKGENRDSHDPDSFSTKGAWTRIKVLAAGVVMNFFLAWFLISLGFMVGAPEPVDSSQKAVPGSKIQISEVLEDSPAQLAGLKVGDEILKNQTSASGQLTNFSNVSDVQDYINSQKGQEIILKVKRGGEFLDLRAIPRKETPAGQGPLGVALSETALVRYPWYQAFWNGLVETGKIISMIFVSLFVILKNIFSGQGAGADITGPVGIAILTKSVAGMGLVYVLQFAALLSINLGIINILPIPALDGGRILFVLIEKLRGYPISQKTESAFHTVGFALLILLMILVTFKDVARILH